LPTPGDIGKAEIGSSRSPPQTPVLSLANHFESSTLKGAYRGRNMEKERNSRWRFDKTTEFLSGVETPVDFSFAAKVMATHGEEFAICRHGSPGASDKTATISSIIFIPERRGFYYCQGFPCMAPFQWVSF
jgi:hypothetical protein